MTYEPTADSDREAFSHHLKYLTTLEEDGRQLLELAGVSEDLRMQEVFERYWLLRDPRGRDAWAPRRDPLGEIGAEVGVTRERVRQLLQRANTKVRLRESSGNFEALLIALIVDSWSLVTFDGLIARLQPLVPNGNYGYRAYISMILRLRLETIFEVYDDGLITGILEPEDFPKGFLLDAKRNCDAEIKSTGSVSVARAESMLHSTWPPCPDEIREQHLRLILRHWYTEVFPDAFAQRPWALGQYVRFILSQNGPLTVREIGSRVSRLSPKPIETEAIRRVLYDSRKFIRTARATYTLVEPPRKDLDTKSSRSAD